MRHKVCGLSVVLLPSFVYASGMFVCVCVCKWICEHDMFELLRARQQFIRVSVQSFWRCGSQLNTTRCPEIVERVRAECVLPRHVCIKYVYIS